MVETVRFEDLQALVQKYIDQVEREKHVPSPKMCAPAALPLLKTIPRVLEAYSFRRRSELDDASASVAVNTAQNHESAFGKLHVML